MGMILQRQAIQCVAMQTNQVSVELGLENILALAPIDGKNAMRRNLSG